MSFTCSGYRSRACDAVNVLDRDDAGVSERVPTKGVKIAVARLPASVGSRDSIAANPDAARAGDAVSIRALFEQQLL